MSILRLRNKRGRVAVIFTNSLATCLPVILPLLFGSLGAQTQTDLLAALVRISGRVLLSGVLPAVSVTVQLRRLETDDRQNDQAVITDERGAFQFLPIPPGKYRISPGSGYKGTSRVIEVSKGKDVFLTDFSFVRCPAPTQEFRQLDHDPDLIGNLTLNQIVIDPQAPGDREARQLTARAPTAESHRADRDAPEPQCWSGMASLSNRSDFEHLSNVPFASWVSLEAFVGGTVNAIHVVRVSANPPLTPEQIKEEVRKVWLGSFRYAASSIGWSEGNPWNIEASVEFDDGTRTSMWTDGGHVQVEDREGKYWFLRLWPAVD